MMNSISVKYAIRHLRRHFRRTLLSVIGVGLGVGIGLLAMSWISGGREMQIRAIVESGTGNMQIIPKGWLDKRSNSFRLQDWEAAYKAAKAHPNVAQAVPQVRSIALLAFGNKTVNTELEGVIPSITAATSRIIQLGKIDGNYLSDTSKGEIVIGKKIAQKLDVECGDSILLRISCDSELNAAMFDIVGILETKNGEIDKTFAHIHMNDVESISKRRGAANIAIVLKNHKDIDDTIEELQASINNTNEVVSWKKIMPFMAANIDGDTASTAMIIMIIMVVVGLGIIGAQLTAVLERRKEFAILVALGMKTRQLVMLVMFEAIALGIAGAITGLAISGPLIYHLATKGFDLGQFFGEGGMDFSSKIFFDPIMYADAGWWLVGMAFAMSLLATIAASIYPSWFAVKTDPAEALRVV